MLVSLLVVGCQNAEEKVETKAPKPTQKKVSVVKITEFFDFGCSHCKKEAEIMSKIKAKYQNKINVDIKHFPLSPKTFAAAEASECGRAQGKFQEYHDKLFENFGKYDETRFLEIAKTLQLDEQAFATCLSSGIMKTKVQADQTLGREFGAKGTPYFVINDSQKIAGAIPEASLSNLIDKLLMK